MAHASAGVVALSGPVEADEEAMEEEFLSALRKENLSAGQSLASVLNNPKPKEEFWFFWPTEEAAVEATVPPLPPEIYPEVLPSEFDRYVERFAEAHERFARVRRSLQESTEVRIRDRHEVETASSAAQGEGLVICLRAMPNMFFSEDFNLGRRQNFEKICPEYSVEGAVQIQEQLQSHLELVEMNLLKEISARSDKFFEALGVLQELNASIHRTVDRIFVLRRIVQALDSSMMKSAAHIRRLHTSRSRMKDLEHKLYLISEIQQSQDTLKILLPASDYAGALDVIGYMQRIYHGNELVGLHCFRHLGEQMEATVGDLNLLMERSFISELLQVPKGSSSFSTSCQWFVCRKLQPSQTLQSLADASVEALALDDGCEVEMDQYEGSGLYETLLPLFLGLLKTGHLAGTLRKYRDRLTTQIKGAIKSVVGELLPVLWQHANAQSDEGQSVPLADRLRALSAESFCALLSAVYGAVQKQLERASEVKRIVERLVKQQGKQLMDGENGQSGGPANGSSWGLVKMPSSTQCQETLRECSEVVSSACDVAHGRWAKLLGVRSNVHARLKLREYCLVHEETQRFMSATEEMSGKPCYSLRGAMQSQNRGFLEGFHTAAKGKLAMLLESEMWNSAEVPWQVQLSVRRLLGTQAAAAESHQEDEQIVSKQLAVGDMQYNLVNAGVMMMSMVCDYVEVSFALPTLTIEVVHRVVDLFKFFNTRSCQLVLGAGAMQASGLKSITAKHLAMASQTLSALIEIIPALRHQLGCNIPENRRGLVLGDLDRVLHDLRVHRQEIETKLVSIMKERLAFHSRALQGRLVSLPTMVLASTLKVHEASCVSEVLEAWRQGEQGGAPDISAFCKGLAHEVHTPTWKY